MTLWFVGTGVGGAGSLTAEARGAIAGADTVYVERFTSPFGERLYGEVAGAARGRVVAAGRAAVEDGGEILRSAGGGGDVALVSYGDPYVATTHAELRARAARAGIPTRTAHAASAPAAAVGECGLHHYKVGRTATVVADPAAAPATYRAVHENLSRGCHTVLLLEYDREGGFFLGPGEALGLLAGAEADQRLGVFDGPLFVVVASRVGSGDQAIAAGDAAGMAGRDFGPPPHAVIVPGSLHFTEAEALRALADCSCEPADNSARVGRAAARMIARYVPAVGRAIDRVAPLCGGDGSADAEVLENARAYARDAENFLSEGRDEVAILAVGYADGLVDALRIAKGLEPE